MSGSYTACEVERCWFTTMSSSLSLNNHAGLIMVRYGVTESQKQVRRGQALGHGLEEGMRAEQSFSWIC